MSDIEVTDVQFQKGNVKEMMHQVNGRVTDDAAIHMGYLLQEYGLRLTEAAMVMAEHSGRSTITEKDIRSAHRLVSRFYATGVEP